MADRVAETRIKETALVVLATPHQLHRLKGTTAALHRQEEPLMEPLAVVVALRLLALMLLAQTLGLEAQEQHQAFLALP
jgi:hypothetical protein